MKLNLGCGADKRAGWHNVDKLGTFSPDEVVDLEQLPWPWKDSSVDEVMLSHVLEHLGAQADVYIGIMRELWRVCRNGATITIVVPHPRHDDFISDPTHVRPVTGDGLALFSRRANEYWAANGFANTPLALHYGIDLEPISANMMLADPWASDLQAGRIDERTVAEAVQRYNNVVRQQTFVLRVNKP